MLQRDRQTVGVILTLVGNQDISIGTHQPGTESAAVSVRIGGALIYMHDAPTVTAIADQWHTLSAEATRLPPEFNRRQVAPVRGMKEPAVVIDAAGSPPMSGGIVRPRGQDSYLRVQIGRVVFDVRDVRAFGSTMAAFREAETLARTAFRASPDPVRRKQALATAAAAFPSPRDAARRTRPMRPRDVSTPSPVAAVRPDLAQARAR